MKTIYSKQTVVNLLITELVISKSTKRGWISLFGYVLKWDGTGYKSFSQRFGHQKYITLFGYVVSVRKRIVFVDEKTGKEI